MLKGESPTLAHASRRRAAPVTAGDGDGDAPLCQGGFHITSPHSALRQRGLAKAHEMVSEAFAAMDT